jgi:galactose mutarotase-like enzyme
MPCRFDPYWRYNGLECLRIENEHLTLDVLPELGAKIYRLIDKSRDHNLVWHSPRVRPHIAAVHSNFDDHWSGGWDEAFPGGAPSPNRYGDELPYMGELWTSEAQWSVEECSPRRIELTFSITTPITTATWERRLTLDAESPVVRLAYRIANVGYRPFDFNWGIHPVQAISPVHRLDAPARRGHVDEHGGGILGNKGDTYTWPTFGGLDMRRALHPEARDFALHYLTELQDGWLACTDTSARRGFGLVFDQAVFPVIWLWMNYGGWRGYYHAMLEPWTGYPSPLADAVASGRARSLGPGEALETEVSAVLYGGVEGVTRLSADGSVTFSEH